MPMSKEKRTPEEVFNSHLLLRLEGRYEEDIKLNYSEDCVFLTSFGDYKGHEGMLQLVKKLDNDIPGVKFKYERISLKGNVGFLYWTGKTRHSYIDDGADSYIVESGKIIAQTIHYTIRKYGSG